MVEKSREEEDLEEESDEVLVEEEGSIQQQVWYVVNEITSEKQATSVDKLVPRLCKNQFNLDSYFLS